MYAISVITSKTYIKWSYNGYRPTVHSPDGMQPTWDKHLYSVMVESGKDCKKGIFLCMAGTPGTIYLYSPEMRVLV